MDDAYEGMSDRMYDLVVVGGSVAGLNTAFYAAEYGARVVVVDRKKEIGIPVQCAEGIVSSVLEDNHIPLNPEFIASEIRKIKMVTPKGRALTIELKHAPGYVLNRDKFEKYLAQRCEMRGVQFMLDSPVVGCNQSGTVVLKNGETLAARVVVGADGVASRVGKWAGIDTDLDPHDIGKCVQYYARDDSFEDGTIEIYWQHRCSPSGYVWVFSKGGDAANVGLGVPGDAKVNAKKLLDGFIRERCPNAERTTLTGGRVPLAKPVEHPVRGNVLLVGDACRLAFPNHGGGIATALLSGQIAGGVIEHHIEHGMPLSRYESMIRGAVYEKLHRCYEMKKKILEEDWIDEHYWYARLLVSLHKILPSIVERYAFSRIRY